MQLLESVRTTEWFVEYATMNICAIVEIASVAIKLSSLLENIDSSKTSAVYEWS